MTQKRLFSLLLGLVLALGLAVPAMAQEPPRGPSGADGTYNCPDFDYQEEAQAFFEAEGGPSQDTHGLDSDNDGIACENLPSRGTGDEGATEDEEEASEEADEAAEGDDEADDEGEAPSKVDAGSGGAADRVPGYVLALMLAGLMLAAGGIAFSRR
jgi:hypothetical protein